MEVSLSRMQTQREDGRERRGQQSNGQMEADGELSASLDDPLDETSGEQAQGYETLQEEQPEEVNWASAGRTWRRSGKENLYPSSNKWHRGSKTFKQAKPSGKRHTTEGEK